MKKPWMVRFPMQGKWFHVMNLAQVGEINEYAKDHLVSHHMRVYIICGSQMRRWELKTPARIKTLHEYLRHNVGSDNLRLRFKVQEKP